MIESLLIAAFAITALMIGWGLIQALWKNTFSEYLTDEDVLADRRSCGNCGCTTACENENKKTNL